MDKDHTELIEYLDKKFTAIESILEQKADKEDVRLLTNSIDAVLKRLVKLIMGVCLQTRILKS